MGLSSAKEIHLRQSYGFLDDSILNYRLSRLTPGRHSHKLQLNLTMVPQHWLKSTWHTWPMRKQDSYLNHIIRRPVWGFHFSKAMLRQNFRTGILRMRTQGTQLKISDFFQLFCLGCASFGTGNWMNCMLNCCNKQLELFPQHSISLWISWIHLLAAKLLLDADSGTYTKP